MKTPSSISIPVLIGTLLFGSFSLGKTLADRPGETIGMSTQSHQQLMDFLQASVEDGSVPGGIVILIHRGETVFRQSFGYRELRDRLPFEMTTPFRAASLSKSMISTLVVKLHADGVLNLDEPIDRKLPAAKLLRVGDSERLSRMPTLRECLHHTAGFTADESQGGRPWLRFRGQGITLAEAVNQEFQMPMQRQPGETFAYSGIGYDIAGRVIEVATGKLLDDALQDLLCTPLGMNRTTYHPNATAADELAGFYWRWRSDGRLRRQLDSRIVSPGQYASVGGGIVTTADDLASFMLMHRNSGVVDRNPWIDEQLLKQQYLRKRPGSFYGLGFTLGAGDQNDIASWILHTGSSGTMFWWDRQTDVIGIIVTQQRYSKGEDIPESNKLIAKGTDSWPTTLKKDYIDPIFGWRPLKTGATKTMKLAPQPKPR